MNLRRLAAGRHLRSLRLTLPARRGGLLGNFRSFLRGEFGHARLGAGLTAPLSDLRQVLGNRILFSRHQYPNAKAD